MTPGGERLGRPVRIDNDPFTLAEQVGSGGESPEVVLEATYGWYWAADVLAQAGAQVHLAHPLGVKAFAYRRVKNDERDAADLCDLLRMGRLPEAWVAPPEVRGLREAVRQRCKLVAIRSGLKAQVHAVLAKQGVAVKMSELFGVGGNELLDTLRLDAPFAARGGSLPRLIDAFTVEIDILAKRTGADLSAHPRYRALPATDGGGPELAALFGAPVGPAGPLRPAGPRARRVPAPSRGGVAPLFGPDRAGAVPPHAAPAGGEGMNGNRIPGLAPTVHISRWRTRHNPVSVPGATIVRRPEPASRPSPPTRVDHRRVLTPTPRRRMSSPNREPGRTSHKLTSTRR